MTTGCEHSGSPVIQGLTPWSRVLFVGLWCQLSLPFVFIICGAVWVVFLCGLKSSTVYVGSGVSWEWFHAGKVQPPLEPGLGLPDRRHKMIFNRFLLVLGLEELVEAMLQTKASCH